MIRQHLGIQPFNAESKTFFLQAIKERVNRHQAPKQIFQEVLALLKLRNIEIPGYNMFSFEITKAISHFERNMVQQLSENLSDEFKIELDNLLKTDDGSVSLITQLKTISHSKKPKAIGKSIQAFQLIKGLYEKAIPIIKALDLHEDALKHYATWIRKARFYQINQLKDEKRHLYLLCFIIQQMRLRQDHLTDIFLSCVKGCENAVVRTQKEEAFRQTEPQKETLQLLHADRVSHKALVKKNRENYPVRIINRCLINYQQSKMLFSIGVQLIL